MNKLQQKRWESLKLLSSSYNLTKNVIKFSKGETIEHFVAKCLLCKEAKDLGFEFVTEAIFLNKSRADIFILDLTEAWEVLGTETREMLSKKNYPCEIIAFEADKVFEQNWNKIKKEVKNK